MSQPQPPPTIRSALPTDAEVIVRFNALLASESEGKRLDPARLAPGVNKALARPELCRYFVAELDDRIVGQAMVTYEWSDWRDGVFWWLQSVYVEEGYRRRGIFRSIFQHIHQLAREDPDVCGLRLYVEQANQRAMNTYRSLGMSAAGYLVYEAEFPD